MERDKLKCIVEAALLVAGRPLNIDQLDKLFDRKQDEVTRETIRDCLEMLRQDCEQRGFELKQVASGFRLQVKQEYAPWISRLWDEKPPRYSRALLETLALIVYRQPITRAEIEDVRGVGVSSTVIKTLLERDWIRVLGHKEVPGRPALYGSTRKFLDYFNLRSLDDLPSLAELKDLNELQPQLDLSHAQNHEREG
jgi:segregation and condensation protein B